MVAGEAGWNALRTIPARHLPATCGGTRADLSRWTRRHLVHERSRVLGGLRSRAGPPDRLARCPELLDPAEEQPDDRTEGDVEERDEQHGLPLLALPEALAEEQRHADDQHAERCEDEVRDEALRLAVVAGRRDAHHVEGRQNDEHCSERSQPELTERLQEVDDCLLGLDRRAVRSCHVGLCVDRDDLREQGDEVQGDDERAQRDRDRLLGSRGSAEQLHGLHLSHLSRFLNRQVHSCDSLHLQVHNVILLRYHIFLFFQYTFFIFNRLALFC